LAASPISSSISGCPTCSKTRHGTKTPCLPIIAERQQNPFTLKETTESLEVDWEGTAEVLNQTEAFRELSAR